MKKDEELARLRSEMEVAEKAVKERGQLIDSLTLKLGHLTEEGNALEEKRSQAKKDIERLIPMMVVDQVSSSELARSKEKLLAIEAGIRDNRELLEATQRALNSAQDLGENSELQIRRQECRRRFFFHLKQKFSEDCRSAAAELVGKTWMLALLAGGDIYYPGVLESIFPPPYPDRMETFKKDLGRVYGFEV